MLALVAACLLAPCPPARATWMAEATGVTSSSLKAIACPSSTVCYAAQLGAGKVRKVAGGTWSLTTDTGSSASFYGIACWDTAHCLVVGSGGTLLPTADGGATWTAGTGPNSTATLYGVSCPAAAAGTWVAVGTGGAGLDDDAAVLLAQRCSAPRASLNHIGSRFGKVVAPASSLPASHAARGLDGRVRRPIDHAEPAGSLPIETKSRKEVVANRPTA